MSSYFKIKNIMKVIRSVIFVILLIISILSTSELKSLGKSKSKIKNDLKFKSLNKIKQTGNEGANKDGTVETNLSAWEKIKRWFEQW